MPKQHAGKPLAQARPALRTLATRLQVGSIGAQSALPPQLRGLLDLLAVEGELPIANISAAGNRTLAGMRRQVGGPGSAAAGGWVFLCGPAGLQAWRCHL